MNICPSDPPFLCSHLCPACGCEQSLQHVCSQPDAESLAFEALKQSWFGFFKKKIFFTYHRCASCGQLYCPVYFTEEALGRLYGSMPDNTAGLHNANLVNTQKKYFELLLKHNPPPGDYFELGPDIGLLSQFATKQMKGGKLWLYEPNVAVHAQLKSRTGRCEHEIRTEMKDFSAVPDGSIGICVMIHVLDHLPDARAIMSQLARKLRPDGLVLIVTHDERSLLARLLGSRWPAYCLQHPHLFNRDSTRKFLNQCGLEAVETVKTVNYFPVLYLFRHLSYALGLRFVRHWSANGFVVPVKLGNIATIARLKKVATN